MYSIDLAGYGTLQVPEKDAYCLAGFSDKIFDLMKFFEEDKDALVNTIKAIEMKLVSLIREKTIGERPGLNPCAPCLL